MATGLNDSGQIVGQGVFEGQERAFLMSPTPVPEPAAWLVFGAIGLCVAAGRYARLLP